jgi:transcriptional regulator with XRE-family HTH domain
MGKGIYDYEKATKLRKAAGLTQEQLAEALERDRVTIARFETGVTESLELLIEYTGYFNKDYRKFLLPVPKSTAKNFSEAV